MEKFINQQGYREDSAPNNQQSTLISTTAPQGAQLAQGTE